MTKILPFKTNDETLQDFLTTAIAQIEELECANAVIMSKAPDGFVIIGYYNLPDLEDRQVLCAHLQCDIIDRMVSVNMERYIKDWEGE